MNVAVMTCVASSVRVVARVPRVAAARGRGSVSAVRTHKFDFSLVAPTTRAATVGVRAKEELQKREMADADASIEPCLVGWSDVDENGVEVYCCEQPGGAMQCKTIEANPEHEECELEVQDDGSSTSAATRTTPNKRRWRRNKQRTRERVVDARVVDRVFGRGSTITREKYQLVSSSTPRDSTHIRHHARLCFARRSGARRVDHSFWRLLFKRIHASGVARVVRRVIPLDDDDDVRPTRNWAFT